MEAGRADTWGQTLGGRNEERWSIGREHEWRETTAGARALRRPRRKRTLPAREPPEVAALGAFVMETHERDIPRWMSMKGVLALSLLALGPCSKRLPLENRGHGTAASGSSAAPAGASAVAASVKATTVTTMPAIGPRAPHASTTALAAMSAQRCTGVEPVAIGSSDAPFVPGYAAAFGAADGLIAWMSKRGTRLSAAPLAKDGKRSGPAVETDVPAELDRVYGVIRLADAYVAFLSRTNFNTTPLSNEIYALPLRPDGTALGPAARLDIGHHNAVGAGAVSAGAANGFAIFEGSSTTGAKARLLVAEVSADGALTQLVKDLDGVEPGVDVHFAFGPKHVAVLAGDVLVVDGGDAKKSTIRRDAPNGARFAETNDENGIPFVALVNDPKTRETKSLRYGKLAFDGTTKLDAKPRALAEPLRPPFEEDASFVLVVGDAPNSVTLSASSSIRGVEIVKSFAFGPPGLSSGIWTTELWSGDRFLVLYSAGTELKVAPLRCENTK